MLASAAIAGRGEDIKSVCRPEISRTLFLDAGHGLYRDKQ